MLLKLINQLQVRINHPCSELTPRAIIFLNSFLSKLRTAIPILVLLHKGIFYIYGRYYSLGRRMAGLDYAKVMFKHYKLKLSSHQYLHIIILIFTKCHLKIYGQRPMDTVSWGLRLLGVATLIQGLLKIWQNETTQETATTDISDRCLSHNCLLCLEATATTATVCGHLFCWKCLSDWLRVKPQCPFCREYVPPSRIIHLMNL